MSKNLVIYYGTMTGNSEMLAHRAQDAATAAGRHVQVANLADTTPADLVAGPQTALFVVSTWGDGEPPPDAENFFAALTAGATDLSRLRFAVFGLGDSAYDQFNVFAKQLESRLLELGAQAFLPHEEADCDFEKAYVAWEPNFLAALAGV